MSATGQKRTSVKVCASPVAKRFGLDGLLTFAYQLDRQEQAWIFDGVARPAKETPPANVSTTAGLPIEDHAGNSGWGCGAAAATENVASEVGRPSVCSPRVHHEQGVQLF